MRITRIHANIQKIILITSNINEIGRKYEVKVLVKMLIHIPINDKTRDIKIIHQVSF